MLMSLEQPHLTDEMRHVPSLDWISTKLDYDVRRRIDILLGVVTAGKGDHETVSSAEHLFWSVHRWLNRITHLAHRRRTEGFAESDLRTAVTHAAYEAASAVASLDRNRFRRRTPYHLMARSEGEQIWECMLAIGALLEDVRTKAKTLDPDVDLRIFEPYAPGEPRPVVFRSA